MEFRRIFSKSEQCPLWACCFPEDCVEGHENDVLNKLLDQWSDTQYLEKYFNENIDLLSDPFWRGMDIDDAIDKVLDEVEDFETELRGVVNQSPGYEGLTINDIFIKLHDSITSLQTKNEDHRKGKPNVNDPFLRLFGIELNDGTIIITGGGIKLKKTLDESRLSEQHRYLERVQTYLKQEGISDLTGLI